MVTEEQKQQIYDAWVKRGSPWFDLDPAKEPTYAERQIIIEMKKRENDTANRLATRTRPKNEIKEFDRLLKGY